MLLETPYTSATQNLLWKKNLRFFINKIIKILLIFYVESRVIIPVENLWICLIIVKGSLKEIALRIFIGIPNTIPSEIGRDMYRSIPRKFCGPNSTKMPGNILGANS